MLTCQVQGLPRVPELPDQFCILAFAGPRSDNFAPESTGFGSAILYQYFSVSGMLKYSSHIGDGSYRSWQRCLTFESLYNPGSTFSNLALHWNNSYCLTTMQVLLVSFIVEVPY